jgi:hypothetical protein
VVCQILCKSSKKEDGEMAKWGNGGTKKLAKISTFAKNIFS